MSDLISRRSFLGGALSCGALAGLGLRQAFAEPFGRPNLTFGVVSDIHFVYDVNGIIPAWGPATFEKTLAWYRDQGVDAVLVCGDLGDRALCEEWQAVADAWFRVFPDDRAPDGRHVERVFITGNHDWEGHKYGTNVARIFPDEAERAKHVVRTDIAGWWKKVFHEDYESVFRKDVKGYAFIGQHWEDAAFKRLPAFLQGAGGKGLDPAKPLFYLQHAHLRDTCYGTDAAGDSDCGDSAKALAAYPNAVAFSGHSHYPLTDERSIWQGAFTSVGAASLRYSSIYFSANCEDAWSTGKDAARRNAEKVMPMLTPDLGTRQGLLVRVYADRIVYRRRDFLSDQSLGADWVQPLVKTVGKRPYAFAEHAKRFRAPQFAADAKLTFAAVQAKNRGGKDVPAILKPCVRVDIPPVVPNPQGRVFIYDLSVSSASGETVERRVTAKGFNRSLEHADAKAVTPCVLALDSLPKGPLKFRVTPVNSFGAAGLPIGGTFVVNSSACGAERK